MAKILHVILLFVLYHQDVELIIQGTLTTATQLNILPNEVKEAETLNTFKKWNRQLDI